MSAVAKLHDIPDRQFKARYWSLDGDPQAWLYLSVDRVPHMIAVDLLDTDSKLQPIISRMRAGQHPFRDAREVSGGQIGRFLVAELTT